MKQYFKFDGLIGFMIAVAGLLTFMGILAYLAIQIQQKEATNFYTLDTSLNALQKDSDTNYKYYKLEKDN